MPIQNAGEASGSVISPRTSWSGQRSRLVAATRASGTAIRTDSTRLYTTRKNVTPVRRGRRSMTGVR